MRARGNSARTRVMVVILLLLLYITFLRNGTRSVVGVHTAYIIFSNISIITVSLIYGTDSGRQHLRSNGYITRCSSYM